ncbi:MAG: DUF4932 domain-containing protein [Candidatus Kryptoniota bacterium]
MASPRFSMKSIGKFAVLFTAFITTFGASKVFGQEADSLFGFSADVRIFTAFAMMNAAGTGGEWHHGEMNPMRSELRADLAGQIDSTFLEKLKEFHESHGRILETYEAALLTSGPPDFLLSYNPKTTGEIEESARSDSDLPELLAEFYKKADIADLWVKYRPLIQAENDKYKPFAGLAMKDVDSYCHLDSNYFSSTSRRISFHLMPMLPYYASLTARVNDEIYIIVGPQEDKPDRSIFYYYLLRYVTMPLVRADTADVDRIDGLYDSVKSEIDIRHGNWNTLVAECFAEAMDIRLEKRFYKLDSAAVDSSLMTEYKFGFILCPTIYKSLEKYENSGMSFRDYFPVIMKSIDLNEETARWNKFWSMQ